MIPFSLSRFSAEMRIRAQSHIPSLSISLSFTDPIYDSYPYPYPFANPFPSLYPFHFLANSFSSSAISSFPRGPNRIDRQMKGKRERERDMDGDRVRETEKERDTLYDKNQNQNQNSPMDVIIIPPFPLSPDSFAPPPPSQTHQTESFPFTSQSQTDNKHSNTDSPSPSPSTPPFSSGSIPPTVHPLPLPIPSLSHSPNPQSTVLALKVLDDFSTHHSFSLFSPSPFPLPAYLSLYSSLSDILFPNVFSLSPVDISILAKMKQIKVGTNDVEMNNFIVKKCKNDSLSTEEWVSITNYCYILSLFYVTSPIEYSTNLYPILTGLIKWATGYFKVENLGSRRLRCPPLSFLRNPQSSLVSIKLLHVIFTLWANRSGWEKKKLVMRTNKILIPNPSDGKDNISPSHWHQNILFPSNPHLDKLQLKWKEANHSPFSPPMDLIKILFYHLAKATEMAVGLSNSNSLLIPFLPLIFSTTINYFSLLSRILMAPLLVHHVNDHSPLEGSLSLSLQTVLLSLRKYAFGQLEKIKNSTHWDQSQWDTHFHGFVFPLLWGIPSLVPSDSQSYETSIPQCHKLITPVLNPLSRLLPLSHHYSPIPSFSIFLFHQMIFNLSVYHESKALDNRFHVFVAEQMIPIMHKEYENNEIQWDKGKGKRTKEEYRFYLALFSITLKHLVTLNELSQHKIPPHCIRNLIYFASMYIHHNHNRRQERGGKIGKLQGEGEYQQKQKLQLTLTLPLPFQQRENDSDSDPESVSLYPSLSFLSSLCSLYVRVNAANMELNDILREEILFYYRYPQKRKGSPLTFRNLLIILEYLAKTNAIYKGNRILKRAQELREGTFSLALAEMTKTAMEPMRKLMMRTHGSDLFSVTRDEEGVTHSVSYVIRQSISLIYYLCLLNNPYLKKQIYPLAIQMIQREWDQSHRQTQRQTQTKTKTALHMTGRKMKAEGEGEGEDGNQRGQNLIGHPSPSRSPLGGDQFRQLHFIINYFLFEKSNRIMEIQKRKNSDFSSHPLLSLLPQNCIHMGQFPFPECPLPLPAIYISHLRHHLMHSLPRVLPFSPFHSEVKETILSMEKQFPKMKIKLFEYPLEVSTWQRTDFCVSFQWEKQDNARQYPIQLYITLMHNAQRIWNLSYREGEGEGKGWEALVGNKRKKINIPNDNNIDLDSTIPNSTDTHYRILPTHIKLNSIFLSNAMHMKNSNTQDSQSQSEGKAAEWGIPMEGGGHGHHVGFAMMSEKLWEIYKEKDEEKVNMMRFWIMERGGKCAMKSIPEEKRRKKVQIRGTEKRKKKENQSDADGDKQGEGEETQTKTQKKNQKPWGQREG